jgi:hypothetical protein
VFIDVSNKHDAFIFCLQNVPETKNLRIIATNLLITSRFSNYNYAPSDVRFAISKQAAQKFDVERFNLRKLSELEVRKQY